MDKKAVYVVTYRFSSGPSASIHSSWESVCRRYPGFNHECHEPGRPVEIGDYWYTNSIDAGDTWEQPDERESRPYMVELMVVED